MSRKAEDSETRPPNYPRDLPPRRRCFLKHARISPAEESSVKRLRGEVEAQALSAILIRRI